ncbi:MAG TPA: hypothetical protein VLC73_06025 [Burkholderiales bacterium]|nr:hypothetical protein [Burkholderiales bacterium]
MEPTLDKATHGEPAEYGLEVLCASWNPLAATLTESAETAGELAASLATADVEGFLTSFYRSQQG